MNRFWLGGALLLVPFLTGCTEQIEPGHVGMLFDRNSGKIEPRASGVVWVGVYQELIQYPTTQQTATFVKNATEGDKKKDDSIPASTKEAALLPIDLSVAWHVDSSRAEDAWREFGDAQVEEIQHCYLRPATMAATNVVTGRHSIFDLISKDRANLGAQIQAKLQPIMNEFGVTIDQVLVAEVYPSEAIRGKIDESLHKRNELAKVQIALQQARTEAQTAVIRATQQAEQNRLLASGQGKVQLALKRLELKRKAVGLWKGAPPVVGDNTVPFTNIRLN